MLLIEYGVVRTQEMEVLKLKNVNRLETLHPDHICCCHAWLGGSSINVRRRSWHDTNIEIETRLTLYPDFEKNIYWKLSRDGVCRKYYLQFRLFYTDISIYKCWAWARDTAATWGWLRWLLGYLVFRDLNADMEQLARGLDIGVVASRYLRGNQLHLSSPPSIWFPVVFFNLDVDVHRYIYTIFGESTYYCHLLVERTYTLFFGISRCLLWILCITLFILVKIEML